MAKGPQAQAEQDAGEARRRIAEEAARRTGELDLSGLMLAALPAEIGALGHLHRLSCGGKPDDRSPLADLAPLAGLAGLQSLDCSGTRVADLTPVAGLAGLQSLDCGRTRVADLAPLAGLAGLRSLDCSGTQVADLAPLAGLAGLQSLNCGGTQVADLAPLAGLAGLQSLDCSDTQVADLAPLAGLAGLQSLDCGFTQVADLAPLAGLAGLQSLDCRRTPVADLAPLAGLAGLQSLDCRVTQVADLAPLAGLAGLQSLDCRRTQVADLAPLAGLAGLQSLDCSGTQVADLAPLAGLAGLQALNCRGTRVADLAPLANCAHLQMLDCSDTEIIEIGPLAGLNSLFSLDCQNTKVSDVNTLVAMFTLLRADFTGCQIRMLPRALGDRRNLEPSSEPLLVPVHPSVRGLFLGGNPLSAPLPRLIAGGQPDATRRVLAWLRGELDPAEYPPPPPEAPPDIPSPGRGLHLEIGADGRIGFAPPEALDADGNDLRRLRSLHPELQAEVKRLTAALRGNNDEPAALQGAAADYAAMVGRDLAAIDFDVLYARGVRLRVAAETWQAAVAAGQELALSTRARTALYTALYTVLALHGGFIGATRTGIEQRADEEFETSTQEQRAQARKATTALADALKGEQELVRPEVVAEIAASAAAGDKGSNPARSSLIASAQARHVATTIVSVAVVAAMAEPLTRSMGATGTVLVALLAQEPIKSSKGYAIVKEWLTRQHDHPGNADATSVLRRAHGFVLRQPGVFEGLAAIDQSWAWLRRSVEWIRRNAGGAARITTASLSGGTTDGPDIVSAAFVASGVAVSGGRASANAVAVDRNTDGDLPEASQPLRPPT